MEQNEINVHTHTLADGTVMTHTHGDHAEDGHRHSHSHTPQHKKSVLNRLSKAVGHLESVKRMVEDDRDCSEVIVQLLAVKSAINNTGKMILKEHMSHCIKDAIAEGDYETIEEMNKVIEYFL